MRVTVIFCLFDEEALLDRIPSLLRRVRAVLGDHEVSFLAVDDGSTDGTAAGLARIEGLEVTTHETNRGVGAAMTTGLSRAAGDVAVVYDPDEAYAPETLASLVEAAQRVPLATLSPYHPDGGVEGVPAHRLWLSRAASRLYRMRLRRPDLHTFTCAVRAYRLPDVGALLPAPDDFTAAAWLMARALGEGWPVEEIPAVLRVRSGGASKMRVLRTIRAHLRLLRDLPVTAKGSNTRR